jgi:pSer/pThr/pTyr-binding forkhead associated (FHA) protein
MSDKPSENTAPQTTEENPSNLSTLRMGHVTTHMQSGAANTGRLPDARPLLLEVNGQTVVLPTREMFVIGRRVGDGATDVVDLTPFGAEQSGVSREHVRIRRRGGLIYMTDLNSTNGTVVAGRRLKANAERMIRDGDEVFFGRLKCCIRQDQLG